MTQLKCTARPRFGSNSLEDLETMLPDDEDDVDYQPEERKSIMATKKVAATEAPAAPAKGKAEDKEDNLVHLKTVAAEFDMDPRAVRIHLRAKGYTKPEGRWAWDPKSTDLAKLRKELSEKGKEEPAEEAEEEQAPKTKAKKK